MNLSKKKLTVFFLLLASPIIITSCKEDKQSEAPTRVENIPKAVKVEKKKIEFKIDFPDTVYVGESNDGIIKYKSSFDTITTVFGDKKNNRYTRFILTTVENVNYDFKYLKTRVKDTFGALNNRTIPFYDIKFNKSGTYYIDGIINDIVLIDLSTKDKDGNDMARFIEDEERVTKKVVVIKKNNISQ